jgi:hypothetical protein
MSAAEKFSDLLDIGSLQVDLNTPEEEKERILNVLNKLEWYLKWSYMNSIIFPDEEVFQQLRGLSLPLTEADILLIESAKRRIDEILVAGGLDSTELMKAQGNEFSQYREVMKEVLQVFRHLQQLWGFFIPKEYQVKISRFGTFGSYNVEKCRILVRVVKALLNKPLETLIHESIHIGIEECIVKKYDLNQLEKEVVVDLLCTQFRRLIPEFIEQCEKNPVKYKEVLPLREFLLGKGNFADNLPDLVSEYKLSQVAS